MAKTKAQPPLSLPDDPNLVDARIYPSDQGGAPRIAFTFSNGVVIDRPFSDFNTVTGAQKTQFRNTLIAFFNEAFTLEGYL